MRAWARHFSDDDKAEEFLEAIRWPTTQICPHCGVIRNAHKLQGESTRLGLYKCSGCRKPFSVTIGTIFVGSHIPLSKWLLAYQLLCTNENGMSAQQLHKVLKITYRSAASMARRIRYTMTQEPLSSLYAAIGEVEKRVRKDFCEPPARPVTILTTLKNSRGPVTTVVKLMSVLHPNGRLQHMTPEDLKIAEASEFIRALTESRPHRIAPKVEEVQGQQKAFAHGQQNLISPRSPAQPKSTHQWKWSSRVTNSKPVPHIPLRFEQVIADVLTMKPPAKQPATPATAGGRK